MHKLRNTNHKEILSRILEIIPLGYKDPILEQMKRKTRRFCAFYGWDEGEIKKILTKDEYWVYRWPFCDE